MNNPQKKLRIAERELVRAATEFAAEGDSGDPENAGDVQAWLDAVAALRRGEDISVYETGRDGRRQII